MESMSLCLHCSILEDTVPADPDATLLLPTLTDVGGGPLVEHSISPQFLGFAARFRESRLSTSLGVCASQALHDHIEGAGAADGQK